MTILAIDTALDACSLALLEDGRASPVTIGEPRATGHAEIFFSLLDRLFETAGAAPGDVRRIVVTVGPGSFTGIRIGLAAARGLALAWGVPVDGATTLDAFAFALSPARPFAVLIDARRGAFYRQVYGAGASAPHLASADRPLAGLAPDVTLAGPGAALVDPQGRAVLAGPAHLPVADLARMAAAGHGLLPPVPLYLRGADARPQTAAALARA